MSEQKSFEQQYNKLQEINNELKKIDHQPLQQELVQQTDQLKKVRQNYDEFWSANQEELRDAAYMENTRHKEFIDLNPDSVKNEIDQEYKKMKDGLDQAREKEDWEQVRASAEQLSKLRSSIKIIKEMSTRFGIRPKEIYPSMEVNKLLDIIGQTLSHRARRVFEYLAHRQGERCSYIDLPFKKADRADQPISQQEINSIKRIMSQIRLVLYSFLGKQGRKLVLYNQQQQYCLLQKMEEIEGLRFADVKSPLERFNEVCQYFQERPEITQEKIIFNYLLEHRNQFVAAEALVQQLWQEQTGKQASLGAISVAIVTLRQRLGDNLKHPFILIKQKRAYCLVPPEGALIPGEVEPKKDETSKKKL